MTWVGPGFVDHHVHLIRVSAGGRPRYDLSTPESIAEFHRWVAAEGITPMDVAPEPPGADDLPRALHEGLQRARQLGVVQVTEAGMTDWAHWDALRRLRDEDRLPIRVRILVASGVADLDRMQPTNDPWLEIEGIKLYADGWLGPRTCAVCQPFADTGDDGILFLDADTLARRAEPYAAAGWRIATHAIGDRAIEAVLDGYQQVFGDDCRSAAPRIEHAQVLRADLIERMSEMGVVACIQPSFAVSDRANAEAALGDQWPEAYRWDRLLEAGVEVITGSDFPIETLDPLVGLRRLVDEPPHLPFETAVGLMTDAAAGSTVLTADPGTDPEARVVEAQPA
jgi:predicted amidohydrolase YtcJ